MWPTACLLPDGRRLHLQHGPSDLVILAEGETERAYRAAAARFRSIIAEVVEELDDLRCKVTPVTLPPRGAVAQRMHAAAFPFASAAFVTRMAAVAGAIADEVLAAMVGAATLTRAYVNNGGDIALHLAPGQSFTSAIAGHDGRDFGRIRISSQDPVRGIATSGRHGRSLSLGIADSVTALAKNAATADVAATLIANAVDLQDHPGITRRAAWQVAPDSDLGDLPVVTGCGALSARECQTALANGQRRALSFRHQNLIAGAGLFLRGRAACTSTHLITPKETQHA